MVAVVEAVAIASMFPLRTVVPYTLDLDRSRGIANLTQDRQGADVRTQLATFVIRRESYDDAHPHDGVDEILARSKGEARRVYANTLKGGVPDRRQLLYAAGTRMHVVVQRVTIVQPGLARLTFSSEQSQGAAILSTLPWQAEVTYSVGTTRGPGSLEDVVVTGYRRSAFIPETTPSVASSARLP